MDITNVQLRLDDLNDQLSIWYEQFNAEANRIFNASPISADTFIEQGREAGRLAKLLVGEGPWEEVHAVLDELCSTYIRLSVVQCGQIRDMIHRYPSILRALSDDYEGRAISLLQSTHESRWIWLCLAAVSIDNNASDFRDTYVRLGDLYITAVGLGINPLPAFHAVAQLSATNVEGSTSPIPMRKFLDKFHKSTYFRNDVSPQLR